MSIGTIAKGCQVICGSEPELSTGCDAEWRGWVGCETGPFPSVFKEGGCAINKCREASLSAQSGWLVKGRAASLFCLNLLTTPSAPLRNGTFLLRRSHPSLKTEEN